MNIYQIYVNNGCRFGFIIRRDTWKPGQCAKVVGIESVKEGEMIEGEPPCFEGFSNPPDHSRTGKIMWPGLVTLEADWLIGGIAEIDSGGESFWEQVYLEWQ